MAVSLARRIRRIGLLPSTKDEKGNTVRNFNTYMSADEMGTIAQKIRAEAKQRRLKQRGKK